MEGPEPFYLEVDGRVIFAVYEPAVARRCGVGVLLCQPLDPEYARCHRAVRQLATRLTRHGFDVLRFDFHGTGDSGGEFQDCRLAGWQEEVVGAAVALRRSSGCERYALVGLRIGATLAASAVGMTSWGPQAVVLWEPLPSGAGYLAAMQAQHQSPTLERVHLSPVSRADDGLTEILGLPYSDALLADFRRLDLAAAPWPPGLATLVVVHGSDSPGRELAATCGWPASAVTTEVLPARRVWDDDEQSLVPGTVIERIVAWIARQF